ncbi:putative DNAJ like protein subfamily C member 21 [Coleophoma cylindrospora]|uniref:Putative DNAJ like protein subfamily C member 21 n=1 Tax=Coleophoma cylindrospora TaxID=1849047 RepID=A0A3D8R1U1_9HELO|nr:putative DNAJ like protein subfamily C member 21 [Coleophoma cylindrospora]
MGAEHSSPRGQSAAQSTVAAKTCYYEVLGVERQASDDEIKKAYRRKALELHPDRNFGDTENATIKFAEVQSAYQVLSDPQERAWYDSHRESILQGDDVSEEEHFERNVRLTTASDIVRLISRFNPSIPFTDASNGFYGILQETFLGLAKEEAAACDWDGLEFREYPEFGGLKDSFDDVVKPFYSVWINFSTQKSFSWKDAYRPSDAPDRRVRRLIEKENKRLREEGVREFNDAVRSLVAFVRKRDPRYAQNTLSGADREKSLREAAAAQRARSRAANQAKISKASTTQSGLIHEHDSAETPLFSESEESEGSEVEHIECVVCGKTFKSEKQYEAHEKSKKHIKAVQQLQREMRKENKLLNLDSPADAGPRLPVDDVEDSEMSHEDEPEPSIALQSSESASAVEDLGSNIIEGGADGASGTETPLTRQERSDSDSDKAESEDEYASRKDIEDRLAGLAVTAQDEPSTTRSGDNGIESRPKTGKAKARRAKKAARQVEADQELHTVSLCYTSAS